MFASNPAFSCSCFEKEPLRKEFDGATAVFSGRVISVSERNDNGRRVKTGKMRVLKSLKGKTAKTLNFDISSDCDYYFENGESYLVYTQADSNLNPGKGPAVLHASNCSRTKRLEKAKEELRTIMGFDVKTGAP